MLQGSHSMWPQAKILGLTKRSRQIGHVRLLSTSSEVSVSSRPWGDEGGVAGMVGVTSLSAMAGSRELKSFNETGIFLVGFNLLLPRKERKGPRPWRPSFP